MDKVTNFIDTCKTNGSSLVQFYNLFVLVISVFLLSIRGDPALRIILMMLFAGIIAQYYIPVQFNVGGEYTEEDRTALEYGMYVISGVSVVLSVFLSRFLLKENPMPMSYVLTNVLLFTIPSLITPIIRFSNSQKLNVNISTQPK